MIIIQVYSIRSAVLGWVCESIHMRFYKLTKSIQQPVGVKTKKNTVKIVSVPTAKRLKTSYHTFDEANNLLSKILL